MEGITGKRYNVIMIIRIIQYTWFGVPAPKMTLILKNMAEKRLSVKRCVKNDPDFDTLAKKPSYIKDICQK